MILNVSDIQMNATLHVHYNNKLKFTVSMAQKLKMHLLKFNFELSGGIKIGTFLLKSDGISRVLYTFTQAVEAGDN